MNEVNGVLEEIMDEAMIQVANQMLSIKLAPVKDGLEGGKGYDFVITQMSGTYNLTLAMGADKELFTEIANRMSRGRASSCDMPEYAIEFFNVLCGRIISMYNRRMKTSYRFKVPVYKAGSEEPVKLEQGYYKNYIMENEAENIILGVYR